jgi:hypothetical protein
MPECRSARVRKKDYYKNEKNLEYLIVINTKIAKITSPFLHYASPLSVFLILLFFFVNPLS